MLQTKPFEPHIAEYEDWFNKYNAVFESELLAIRSHLEKLPKNISGIEVGLGTAKYAAPLGIKEGVEPSEKMRKIAIKKGIEVMDATAEHLPYKDIHFDLVLFVTISHLDSVYEALKEAYRVLKKNGSIIIGFIDKNSQLGKKYEKKRHRSNFYKYARFYSANDIIAILSEINFKNPEFVQTIFKDIDEINEVEQLKEGYGEGAFIVVKATK
jgi:ubiquinone/menaquinone biosynthesis C-methylase UbiE